MAFAIRVLNDRPLLYRQFHFPCNLRLELLRFPSFNLTTSEVLWELAYVPISERFRTMLNYGTVDLSLLKEALGSDSFCDLSPRPIA